ncbi:MAG: hypothetical protein R2758_00040 [Bacteroidales bacterium]
MREAIAGSVGGTALGDDYYIVSCAIKELQKGCMVILTQCVTRKRAACAHAERRVIECLCQCPGTEI